MAVAISGGADSFALLHALHTRDVPVVALTVDHGLRPEAAEEAARVAAWCSDRGISHETLRWVREPTSPFESTSHASTARPLGEASPVSPHPEDRTNSGASGGLEGRGETGSKGNLQANARTARYRLLCEACNRLGLETLVTGHTADDQAETVFMRLRRGSGRGLAGMPAQRLIAGGAGEPVTLYRPLLGLRRSETQNYAAVHDLPVSHDPSNEDDRFERVRVRALLAALEQQDLLTVAALCRTAGEMQELSKVIATASLNVVAPYPFTRDGGSIFADRDTFESNSGCHAAARLVWSISGDSSEGVTEFDPYQYELPKTLSGVLLTHYAGNGWAFIREPAALLGRADGTGGFAPIPVSPGEKHLYDRRFIVHVPEKISDKTELKPFGALLPRDIATSTLDRQRISTLPCLSIEDRLTHVPAQTLAFVHQALSGWKQAEAFLNETKVFEAVSLLEERFTGRVIRF